MARPTNTDSDLRDMGLPQPQLPLLAHSRPKMKKKTLSVAQKKRILQYREENPTASYKAIGELFGEEFGVGFLPKSTLQGILHKQAEKISVLNSSDPISGREIYRVRERKNPRLEEALLVWYRHMEARIMRNEPDSYVSDSAILEKAKELGASLGVSETFTFSASWLCSFKQRHRIRLRELNQHIFPPLPRRQATAEPTREDITILLSNFQPCDVFCFEESELLFNYDFRPQALQPLRFPDEALNVDTRRVTLGFICNAVGTEKQKLVLIGHSKRPASFGKEFKVDDYVDYYFNGMGWMRTGIFREQVRKLNRYLRDRQRRGVLLCDRGSTYDLAGIQLDSLMVQFLPGNETNDRPFAHGILANFKAKFRCLQLKRLVDAADDGLSMSDVPTTMKDAVVWSWRAWESITPATIQAGWAWSKWVAPPDGTALGPADTGDLIEMEKWLGFLANTTPAFLGFPSLHVMSVEELKQMDAQRPNSNRDVTDDQIVQLVRGVTPPENEQEPNLRKIAPSEARGALEVLKVFFEQQGGSVNALGRIMSLEDDIRQVTPHGQGNVHGEGGEQAMAWELPE